MSEVKRWQSLELSRADRYSNRATLVAPFAQHPHILSSSVTPRLLLAAIAGAALATSACSRDSVSLVAARDTVTDTLVVYALSGTPLAFPTALATLAHTVVRADANIAFDIAFDIDAQGNALLYPFRLIVDPTVAIRPVGILKVDVPFDSLRRAPTGGYRYDSVTVAPTGTVAVIQATREDECNFDVGKQIYSKIVIDEIDPITRRIAFRILVDPACGFRDLVPGRPKR